MKKQQGIIIDLQKNIDELRNRLMQNNSSSETILQVQEYPISYIENIGEKYRK